MMRFTTSLALICGIAAGLALAEVIDHVRKIRPEASENEKRQSTLETVLSAETGQNGIWIIHEGSSCPPGWHEIIELFIEADGTTMDACVQIKGQPTQAHTDYLLPGEKEDVPLHHATP